MKNGFKLFLFICFMFTFVFSLAFAGPGGPNLECELGCCYIEATTECTDGWGTLSAPNDGVCICVPNNTQCTPPQCW